MPIWPFTSSTSSADTSSPSEPPPKPPPNLNSPPGAPIPNAPPSSSNISPLRDTAFTPSQADTPKTPRTSPSQSQSQTAPVLENPQTQQYRRFFYYSSVGVATACPIIAFLPPRKFDLFTFGLGVAFCMSTGYVLEERTGKGLMWHVGSMIPSAGNAHRKARDAQERDEVREGVRDLEEKRRTTQERGVVKRVWMGKEGEDWVEERKRREDEALTEGRGYGGLIVEYIREGLGFKARDDDDEDDEDERGN